MEKTVENCFFTDRLDECLKGFLDGQKVSTDDKERWEFLFKNAYVWKRSCSADFSGRCVHVRWPCGLVVFAIYRTFYLGLVWVEYDMEKVIFHYSRKEEYRFRWEEIPGSWVRDERAGGGYVFYVQGNGRQRKIPLNCLSKRYKDFEKTLELAGVLHRIGAKTQEEFKRDAERVFEQYQKYREAHPGATSPKPEGNCVICPDCQGKGLHFKKLPLLKVDVGKVCKTCGGSGYLPQ